MLIKVQRRTFFAKFFKGAKSSGSPIAGTASHPAGEPSQAPLPSLHIRLERRYDTKLGTGPKDEHKKFLGVRVSDLVYYGKINGAILILCGCVYVYVYGSMWVMSFSLFRALRVGWLLGVATCGVFGLLMLYVRKIVRIPSRAVFNQSFSLVSSRASVKAFLGEGNMVPLNDFFATCRRGGFQRPTLKRLQTFEYGWSDMLGRTPKRLHMTYVLGSSEKGAQYKGRTVLVHAEVVGEDKVAWWKRRSYAFHSVVISLIEADGSLSKREFVVGSQSDVVAGLLSGMQKK